MRFLIDEDMPRSTGNLLRQYGHEAVDMRDIGLRSAKDAAPICEIPLLVKS